MIKDKKDVTPLSFSNLDFKPHKYHADNGIQARLDLDHGIQISVVSHKDNKPEFGGLYGNASDGTYEVAVFHNNDMLPLSPYDDVVGWQSEAEVTELMSELQGKPEDIHAFISQLHLNRKLGREELDLD
tara:strand:- start:779 stop:1165 length:387 start_codon:yes stop_codon:yes gene_type:complete